MTESERDLYAQQYKQEVDLTLAHAKDWQKFQKLKDDYTQKYGAGYAARLLLKEETDLVARFNQEVKDLKETHFQQWMDGPEDQPLSASNLEQVIEKAPDKPLDEFDRSQNRFNDWITSHKERRAKVEASDKQPTPISQRFIQGLSYTRAVEDKDKVPQQDKDKNPDLDRT